MALFRQQGQIFDDTTSLKDRVKQFGTEAPTSAIGAQSLGATPKQQDMAGTKAAKKPIIEDRIRKQDTLQGAQRLDTPRQQATSAEDSAQNRATQLQQIGSLQSRVQSLIEQRLNAANQATIGQATIQQDNLAQILGLTDEQAAATDADSPYNIAKASLENLAANPTGLASEEAFVALTNAGVESEAARNLIDTTSNSTGSQVATATEDTVSVGDLNVQELGFQDSAELAGLLGVDETTLAGMSIEDLQNQVEATRQQEFDRVDELRAQMANAVPGSARFQQLQRELGDLAQVGVTGSEVEIDEAIQDIELADNVEIGDTTVSVEKLLSDDSITQMIVDYVGADEATREKMLPAEIYGDLRAWIDDNQEALAVLSNDLEGSVKSFQQIQDDWHNLTQVAEGVALPPDVLAALTSWQEGKSVTSLDLQQAKDEFEASSVGQLLDNPDYADVATPIIDKLNKDNADIIKNLSVEDLVAAHNYADLANNPAYQTILGLEGQKDFVADKSLQGKLDEYKVAVDAMNNAGVTENWLRDKEFLKLSAQQMTALAEYPAQYDEFQKYNEVKDRISNASDIEDVLSIVTGMNVTETQLADMQSEYDSLKYYAKVGAPGAQEKLDKFVNLLDSNKDGKLTDADTETLINKVKSNLGDGSINSIIGGKGFDDIFSTIKQIDNDDFRNPIHTQMAEGSRVLFDSIREYMDDGKLTVNELSKLPTTLQQEVLENFRGSDWAKGLPTKEEFEFTQHFDAAYEMINSEVAGRIFNSDKPFTEISGDMAKNSSSAGLQENPAYALYDTMPTENADDTALQYFRSKNEKLTAQIQQLPSVSAEDMSQLEALVSTLSVESRTGSEKKKEAYRIRLQSVQSLLSNSIKVFNKRQILSRYQDANSSMLQQFETAASRFPGKRVGMDLQDMDKKAVQRYPLMKES